MPRLTTPPGRHLVIVLDASGSMLATDERPTRFDEAVRRARGCSPGSADRCRDDRTGRTHARARCDGRRSADARRARSATSCRAGVSHDARGAVRGL